MTIFINLIFTLERKHLAGVSFTITIALIISLLELVNLYLISSYFSNAKSSYFGFSAIPILCFTLITNYSLRLMYLSLFTKLNADISSFMAKQIYENLLQSSLSELSRLGKGEIMNALMEKCQLVMLNLFNPIMLMIVSFFTSISIICYLTLSENYLFVSGIIFIIVMYLIILLYTRSKINMLSSEQNNSLDKSSESVHWLIEGIRELKFAAWKGLELSNVFEYEIRRLRRTQGKIYFISNSPRIIIEGIIFLLLCAILYYFEEKNSAPPEMIAASFYGFMKVLPSFQTVYAGVTAIRSSVHPARSILKMIQNTPATVSEYSSINVRKNDICLEIRDLVVKLSDNDRKLTIPNKRLSGGSILGIYGPSGSGKSSLLDCLSGLGSNYHGEIFYFGNNLRHVDRAFFSKDVSYIGQTAYIIGDDIRSIYHINSSDREKRVTLLLKRYNLHSVLTRLERGIGYIGTNGSLLSGGEKKRIAWIKVLLDQPSLLFLDEITAGLDEENEKLIMEDLLRLKNTTTVIVTHSEFIKTKIVNSITII